ncbi:hypothetical protein V496_01904 [Aspergillus terreus]|uniref:Uncharacterized protein n=1 Tax=Aspergillus terreus TaxID=33178 RepID=A0A5M3YWC0_ASPTE|nr:hypothetical protein ATETN484_0005012400 [Aspergillus terreus]GFF16789.1 hypothetical protein V496_01904 [Aspergillus terreus]
MTYTASLNRLTKPTLQPELYSRVQYETLARHLSAAPNFSRRVQDGHWHRRPRPNSDAFVHVVVHTFQGNKHLRRDDFDLKDGLAQFVDHPQPTNRSDQVVFVRGSLSAAWVEALGTKYKIDPEFFRRHLRYLPGPAFSDLPSLPSANTEMMTLILASLYIRKHTIAPGQIRRCREMDSDVARRNQKSIYGDMLPGETIVRRFSTLSDRLFSLEHEVSIFTRIRKNGSQIAVVLLDNGLEMNRENGPACFSRQDSMIPRASVTGISPIPVIVPRPSTLNINVVHPDAPIHYDPAPPNSIGHVASLLPFYLGMSTNTPCTRPDIFALIPEVFRLVAGSECQFLNQLRGLVQEQDLDPPDGENMNLAINTLRYIKAISEDHKQSLKQNIAFLQTRCPANPDAGSASVAGSSTQAERAHSSDELTSILIDFEELLVRAESVGSLCTETMGLILNGAMLRESQKAIQRADDQRRLTVLAYLFLPLTVVFGLFGMNVEELGTGSHSIWVPFAVLAPVGCISWALFYPRKKQLLKSGIQLLTSCGSNHHTQGATISSSNSRDNEIGSV